MTQQSGVAGRREALREAIMVAAETRVAASGLVNLGVREIAQEAGCSSGMVYKLFASHDDLVLSINARTLAALADALGCCLVGVDGPVAAIAAMAEAYLDYAIANTPRWDALFAHRMSGGATPPAWYADQRDALFDGLTALMAAGAVHAPDQASARTLFSAVHGVVSLGLQQKFSPVSHDALRRDLRAFVAVLTRGMFAAPP